MATIRYSTNGVLWVTIIPNGLLTDKSVPYSHNLISGTVNSICNDQISWVISASNGLILVSDSTEDTVNQFYYAGISREGVTWSTVSPNFGSSRIRSTAYGNNLWVAVGDGGQIRSSTNAVTWVTRTSNIAGNNIFSVAYGNGVWVVGAATANMRRSTDTITWTTVVHVGSNDINKITFANNLWMMGDSGGIVKTSPDGSTWTTRSALMTSFPITSIAYGNEVWAIGGSSGQIRSSTDAITWTTRTSNLGSSTVRGLAYNNGLWIAAGYVFNNIQSIRTSTNAITWVTQNGTVSHFIMDAEYGNGLFITAGGSAAVGGQISTSTNGVNWTTRTSNCTSQIQTIDYGNNIWIFSGAYGDMYRSVSTQTFSSISKVEPLVDDNSFGIVSSGIFYKTSDFQTFNSNNLAWVTFSPMYPASSPSGPGIVVAEPTYQNGIWVGIYNNAIHTSTNAIVWTSRFSDSNNGGLNAISYGNGVWNAGAGSYFFGQTKNGLYSSTNGTNWTTTITNAISGRWVTELNYVNNIHVALLNNNSNSPSLMTSTDSISWITRNINFPAVVPSRIAYGSGIYAVSGSSGALSTSTDTVSWTTRTSNFASNSISVLAYNNGVWFAAGASNQIRTSTNGINWTTRTNNDIVNVNYVNNRWIGLTNNSVQISTDAITWVTSTTISSIGAIIVIGENNEKMIFPSSGISPPIRKSVFDISQSIIVNNIQTSSNKNIYLFNNGYIYVINSSGNINTVNTGINDNFLSAAQKSDIYNVVGQNAIYRSTNLVNWTTISTPAASGISDIISI